MKIDSIKDSNSSNNVNSINNRNILISNNPNINNRSNISNNPYFLMALLLVLWGSFAAVSKLVLKNIDSFQSQFYMFAIALISMTLVLMFNGRIKVLVSLTIKDYCFLFLSSVFSFGYYFFYMMALKIIPAVEASMLNYLFPVMILIFSVPINGEKLDKKKVVSILLGFLGMIIILTNGNFQNVKMTNIKGDLLAISGAICWGIFSNLGKKNRIDNFISNYIFVVMSFVFSWICMRAFSSFVVPDFKSFGGLIWLSLSNIVFSYYIWFKALKNASSSLIASLSFITPFITLVFIKFLLGEDITLIQFTGLIIILLGTAVQSIKLRTKY
ncbi:MAG TPA: DMT family transporter [Clostridiaceae bacterium]|nr:DMT family transporter [Clostridiaceae bacterium]